MKKITRLIAGAIAFAGLMITGCNNIVDDSVITNNETNVNKRTLTITASGSTENLKFSEKPADGSKSILPAALDGNDLKFYLWYKNEITGVLQEPKTDTTFYASADKFGREGTVELDLDTSKYTMYLAATKSTVSVSGTTGDGDKVKAAAVLFATAEVDMRYSERASFYLTPYTLNNGKGTVSLNVYAHGWTIDAQYLAADKITFGMYDINTNDLVQGSTTVGGTTADTLTKLSAADATAISNKAAALATDNYVWKDVPAGTYNFKVSFIDSTSTPVNTYVWSDTIVILANQETKQVIPLPNVIGKKPAAPTAFEARYKDPDNFLSDYYDVAFVWACAANNEQYFQLEMLDITDIAAAQDANIATVTAAGGSGTEKTPWETIAALLGTDKKPTFTNSVYNNGNYYVAGSLAANEECVVLKLPLGKRYLARIASVNDAGMSDYTYCNINDNQIAKGKSQYKKDGSSTTLTPVPFGVWSLTNDDYWDPLSSKSTGAACISRFKITYNLGSGVYKSVKSYTSKTNVATLDDIPTFDGAGDSPLTASRTHITSLDGTASSQVIYYSQLPSAGTDSNKVLNPLKVANEDATTNGTKPNFALSSGNYLWTTWKLNSLDGTTVYNLDHSEGLAGQDLHGYSAAPAFGVVDYENPYAGYKNVNLFASYGTAAVAIYSPKDDDFVDYDVLIYKSKGNTPAASLSDAIQITSIGTNGEFKIDNNVTASGNGYGYLYVAVRNKVYSKISIDVRDAQQKKFDAVISNTASIEIPRYVPLTSEPDGFGAALADTYYEFDSATTCKYKGNAANPTWAANKWYYMDDDGTTTNNYTYYAFKIGEQFGSSGAYQITVNGYTPRSPKAPFTKKFTAIMQDAPTYSESYFPSVKEIKTAGSLEAEQYYAAATGPATPATPAADDVDTWAKTPLYQKD